MPSRSLPRSVAGTLKALTVAKLKNDALDAGARFLTAQTQARLNTVQPLLFAAVAASGVALANQSASTNGVTLSKAAARMFISHFFQVFNLGVARGTYKKEERPYFNLDINSEKVPSLTTETDITLWGARIADGDATRVTEGGAAMSNPTTAEVTDIVADFLEKNAEQSPLKDLYDNSLEAIQNLLIECNKVVKKIWDEVETFYNEETDSSKRRKAREWGVFYVSDVDTTINVFTRDSVTHAQIGAVHCEMIETGLERDTAADGTVPMVTKASDGVTIHFTHPDYVAQDVVVEFETGTLVYNITVDLVHV